MRRRDIHSPHELEPSEYAKLPVTYLGRTFDAWWYVSPNGIGPARLSMPEDVDLGVVQGCHYVEEHEDGEITVQANPPQDPGNSNSILVTGWPLRGDELRAEGQPLKEWHGWIHHGEWRHL